MSWFTAASFCKHRGELSDTCPMYGLTLGFDSWDFLFIILSVKCQKPSIYSKQIFPPYKTVLQHIGHVSCPRWEKQMVFQLKFRPNKVQGSLWMSIKPRANGTSTQPQPAKMKGRRT